MPGTEDGKTTLLKRAKLTLVCVCSLALLAVFVCDDTLMQLRLQAPDPAHGHTHLLHPLSLSRHSHAVYVSDGDYAVSRGLLAIGCVAFALAFVLREIERRRALRSPSQ